MRDQLPAILVPFDEGDTDAQLDLQAVVHQVYDDTGCCVMLYNGTPKPPLLDADASWAEQLIQSEH